MESPEAELLQDYRRNVRLAVWFGVPVGLILVLLGLFFGDWFTIFGVMIVIVSALWYWSTEFVPDRLLAERLNERRRKASPDSPPPPPSSGMPSRVRGGDVPSVRAPR